MIIRAGAFAAIEEDCKPMYQQRVLHRNVSDY